MKISFKKEEFLSSLNIVSKAIKRGGVYPILECVLIDCSKNSIVLTCTDGKELTIKKESKGVIKEKGKAAIECNRLIGIIRNMPDDSDIELETNNKSECFINFGENIKNTIQTKDETTYPNIMTVNKDNKVIINEYKLKKIIDKTSFSYDKSQTTDNIILKGIYISINKEKIVAKSMNGFILSVINEGLIKDFGKYETIVPGQTLEEVNKLIKGDVDKDVIVYFNDKNIAFEFNDTLVSSIIIPNTYIDTDKIINLEYSTKITVDRSNFIESINRSTEYVTETEKKPVIIDIKDEEIVVTLTSIQGEYFEKLPVKKTGKDLRIAFNPNSLFNILNVIDDDEITLYFSGSKQPVIIKDKQETYTYLLTAVNI